MKNLKNLAVAITIATSLVACDSSKKNEAQKNVDEYVTYVDSVALIAAADLNENWESIEATCTEKKLQAQSDVETVNDEALKEKINEANTKYEDFKQQYLLEAEGLEMAKNKMNLRKSFFKDKVVGDDMSFTWVNKDNILPVYDAFVNTAITNKDSYSREDWDEIKILYEALDSRKNTVEKEGLSSSDNLKIAGLKMKFAPVYTVNRTGAKSEENAEAKK